jgi:hypothetical protein
MKAPDDDYAVTLNLEENSVGKSAHAGSTPISVNDREPQRIGADRFDRRFDHQRKLIAELRADGPIQVTASPASASASGTQTTGKLTPS